MSIFRELEKLREDLTQALRGLEDRLRSIEQRIEHLGTKPPTVSSLTFGWGSDTNTYIITPQNGKATITMSDASFSDSSSGDSATLSLADAAGVTVTPTTAPVWTADDNGSIITLTVAADGMSATAVPATPPQAGTSNVTITFTNPDNTEVTATTTVTVTGGDATSMQVAWSPIQATSTPTTPPTTS